MSDLQTLPTFPDSMKRRKGDWTEEVDTSDPSWATDPELHLDESLSTTETTEKAIQMHEENASSHAVQKAKLVRQDELTPAEGSEWEKARFGQILHYLRFLNMLNKVIPAHYNESGVRGRIGLNVKCPTQRGGKWFYVGACQVPYMTEYEIMHKDSYGVTAGQAYRGWRTVLLLLTTFTYCPICCVNDQTCIHPESVRVPYMTEEQVNKAFPAPVSGPVSRRYRETLHAFRSHR